MRERVTRGAVTVAALGFGARVAAAHPGRALAPHDAWSAWSWEPAVLGGLALAAWLYVRGVRALWRRAGRGRGIARWRAGCYAAGLLAVAVALVSPVDAMGEALFSMHMVQHLVLMMVAAPLLLLGEPLTATLWALPRAVRSAVGRAWRRVPGPHALWRAASAPLVAWTLHVATLWAWHARGPYERAVLHRGVHVLEHVTFFATALLFWVPIADRRARRRLGLGAAVLYLFTAALQSTALGALITTAARPWYTVHSATTRAWGLSPIEDQQLAGLIMWVPAGFVYLAALAAELTLVLGSSARAPRRALRAAPAPSVSLPPAASR